MTKRPHSQSSHEKLGESHHQSSSSKLEIMIDEFPNPQSPDCCIYRAPIKFRQGNEKFFIPQLVSVGPLHHGLQALQYMEEHKPAYLKAFIDRSPRSFEDIVMKIEGLENRIRNSYTEKIKNNRHEFVEMIVLDSCFVIEAIWRSSEIMEHRDRTVDQEIDQETDYLSRSILISEVRTDLILLENQLPFFVLEDLYNYAFPNAVMKFRALCLKYFEIVMLAEYSEELLRTKCEGIAEVRHILDLLRTYHAPSGTPPSRKVEQRIIRIHNATKLRDEGMAFKIREGGNNSASDIEYTKGKLELPKIKIGSPEVEHLLRNLLAFERCHYQNGTDVTDYLLFLDDLIDTSEDVDVLIGNGILENFLSDSNAVATLLNGLHVRIHSRRYRYENYYASTRGQINEYCNETRHSWRGKWNSWRAVLKRDYCGTPWLVASTLAAAALLTLTLIQTYYAVISFYDNSK